MSYPLTTGNYILFHKSCKCVFPLWVFRHFILSEAKPLSFPFVFLSPEFPIPNPVFITKLSLRRFSSHSLIQIRKVGRAEDAEWQGDYTYVTNLYGLAKKIMNELLFWSILKPFRMNFIICYEREQLNVQQINLEMKAVNEKKLSMKH